MAPLTRSLRTAGAVLIATLGGALMAEEGSIPPDSVSSMIKAGLPVFAVKPQEIRVASSPLFRRPMDPTEFASSNGVVRMSPYVTFEKKVLTSETAMSKMGLEDFAMDKFIGEIDGLDRGILNVVTLRGLWARIPVLNIVDFAGETNEERAMRLYRLDRQADILNEKRDFDALSRLESTASPR